MHSSSSPRANIAKSCLAHRNFLRGGEAATGALVEVERVSRSITVGLFFCNRILFTAVLTLFRSVRIFETGDYCVLQRLKLVLFRWVTGVCSDVLTVGAINS